MSSGSNRLSLPLLAAGILGLSGVGLGAIGAHALRAPLAERGMSIAWETAARYHLFHAVALVALAAWERGGRLPRTSSLTRWTAWSWVTGAVLFSGSLYGLALGGPRWLGPITPLGGIAFLIGWLLIAVAAWGQPDTRAHAG